MNYANYSATFCIFAIDLYGAQNEKYIVNFLKAL